MMKLPSPLIKFAFIISWLLVSLTTDPSRVQAQTAESVINPLKSPRIHFDLPPDLGDGAPTGRRRGGTGRDGCPALNTPITALVPGETSGDNSVLASTVADYPTFWVYVPELPTTSRAGEFVLQVKEDQEEKEVYRTSLTLPEKSGIISISLPPSPPYSLKRNQKYHWYFKVYCGAPPKQSEYFYVDAWVERVTLTPDLENQLKAAKPGKYIAYATNNIWYDALTNLADLCRTDSHNVVLQEDWADLLKAVGLQDLAQVPIVESYSPAQ